MGDSLQELFYLVFQAMYEVDSDNIFNLQRRIVRHREGKQVAQDHPPNNRIRISTEAICPQSISSSKLTLYSIFTHINGEIDKTSIVFDITLFHLVLILEKY